MAAVALGSGGVGAVDVELERDTAALDFCRKLKDAHNLDELVLDPALVRALSASGTVQARLGELCDVVFDGVLSLPVLSEAALVALSAERPEACRGALPDPSRRPASSAVANFLRARVLPELGALLGQAPLAPVGKEYVLSYAPCASPEAVDGGRVHRMHQDDSDLTLAVAIADADPWVGSDLLYARHAHDRPGTPDPDEDVVVSARYSHVRGRGVVHVGDTYHRVEPITSGARGTLVLLAMRTDADWKLNYYRSN